MASQRLLSGVAGQSRQGRGLMGAALLGVLTTWGLVVSCGQEEHPPPAARPGSDAGGDGDGGLRLDATADTAPPPPDAAGLCGNDILPLKLERPNLYFVLDRSGSMEARLTGSGYSKYVNARSAIGDVLATIGHRVAYGAAVFPRFASRDACDPGDEVFATRAGDSVTYAVAGTLGPTLQSFNELLAQYSPNQGMTPTSRTLSALLPKLKALSGKTSVVLATDGAPNCNPDAACDASLCEANVAGANWDKGICAGIVNCCDGLHPPYGPKYCIDSDATLAAVAALAEANIKTYVIGLPNDGDPRVFSRLLSSLATVGGTARASGTPYYSAKDSDSLSSALREIAAGVAISCTVALTKAPPDWSKVNVYFDNGVVLGEPKDGWAKVNANTLELRGKSCELLKSGDVFQVQVVAGCTTILK